MMSPLERVDQPGNVTAQLARRSLKQFAITAAERSESRTSFLNEPDQSLSTGGIHNLSGKRNLDSTRTEAAKVTGCL